MRSGKTWALLVLVCLTGIMVLVAACGSAASSTATATRPVLPTPTAGPTPTAFVSSTEAHIADIEKKWPGLYPPKGKPVTGGRFQMGYTADYPTRDFTTYYAPVFYHQVYDRIVRERFGAIQDLYIKPQIEPALAEKWEHPDAVTYIFTLRKGVKFHNLPPVNGREVTVDDAVYSLETLRNSVQVKQRLQDVAKVEKIDDTRFKVTLKYPVALFLEKLGQGNSPSVVWPKEAEALPGGLKDNSIGTGAFILKEWKSKEGWKVDRNPNWWDVDQYGNRLPYLDGIDYYLITDRAAYEAAFRTGKSDIWVPSRAEQVENMQKTNPDIVVSRIPPATPYSAVTLNFRLDKAPYNDDRVRRAMSMAVDRELVINTAFKGDAYFGPMTSWLYGGGGQWPAPRDRLGPYYKYNAEAAKKLMAEAGYSAGFKMPVAITSASMSAEAGDTLLIVQDQLRKNLNVEIEFQVMEAAAFTAKRDKGDWDGAILLSVRGRGTGGWDWDDWVYYEWRSGSPNVVDSLKDEVLDKKLDDCRATEEKSAQEKCRADIWNHLHDKIYRLSFVSYPRYEVTQPWVENWGNYTYSWGISAGQHQIVAVWLTEKAPADRRK